MGTPAVTTRGMREPEMEKIAGWIAEVLDHLEDAATEQRVRGEVAALAAKFPLYVQSAGNGRGSGGGASASCESLIQKSPPPACVC